ncbi:MAG TPA: ABC transporter ATP-binding protein [Candidatus Anoxymicrobiaceae bacterium]|jgi:putative ABC transport system ATP-binding protein
MSGDVLIRVEDLVKTYDLGEVKVPALKGVSLTIDKGDFVMVTGRNGSGKSTLMHQLGLLDLPTSGTIHFNDIEVTRLHEKKRSRMRLRDLGYVFQEFALIGELTALENVLLPAMMIGNPKPGRKKAAELLEAVELKGKHEHLPSQLSGGEQQKVAIARSLINDPMVMFADEPTANLDTVAAAEVLDVFKKLNEEQGRTIVMVTHEQEETQYGNRLIRLADGELA